VLRIALAIGARVLGAAQGGSMQTHTREPDELCAHRTIGAREKDGRRGKKYQHSRRAAASGTRVRFRVSNSPFTPCTGMWSLVRPSARRSDHATHGSQKQE